MEERVREREGTGGQEVEVEGERVGRRARSSTRLLQQRIRGCMQARGLVDTGDTQSKKPRSLSSSRLHVAGDRKALLAVNADVACMCSIFLGRGHHSMRHDHSH